jgi:hypothetical protein
MGALLLVALQFRHKLARGEKEVHVDDKGREVIKLKGPWHVSPCLFDGRTHSLGAAATIGRSMYWVHYHCEMPLDYGDISTRLNCQYGFVRMDSGFMLSFLAVIWRRSSIAT